MVYEQVLIHLWREFAGCDEGVSVRAKVNANIPAAPGRMTFQLVRLINREDETEAVPVFARSGMISPVCSSDGYFVMSENTEGIKTGDRVTVYLWR
jgi:molybdopterin molybdotransferase